MSSLCWCHLIIQYIPVCDIHSLSTCHTLDWFLSVTAIHSHDVVTGL